MKRSDALLVAAALGFLIGRISMVDMARATVAPSIGALVAIGDPTTPTQQASVNSSGQLTICCATCGAC